MKLIILLLLAPIIASATCSSISRTNASASQVLTSTKYNADLNAVYDFVNDYDLGCADPGSLQVDALDSTAFAPITNGLMNGCELSYSGPNTLSINKCQVAVSGNLLTTSASNSLTWGCSGCSSEATGSFYVYIKNQSSFSSYISTSSPDGLGYLSGDRVIGAFYNNASLDIATSSVYSWHTSSFSPPITSSMIAPGSMITVNASISITGVVSNESGDFIEGDCTNANPKVCTFKNGFFSSKPKCSYVPVTDAGSHTCVTRTASSVSLVSFSCYNSGGTDQTNLIAQEITCIGQRGGI